MSNFVCFNNWNINLFIAYSINIFIALLNRLKIVKLCVIFIQNQLGFCFSFFYEVIYFFNNPIEIEQFGKVEEEQHTQVTISFLMNIWISRGTKRIREVFVSNVFLQSVESIKLSVFFNNLSSIGVKYQIALSYIMYTYYIKNPHAVELCLPRFLGCLYNSIGIQGAFLRSSLFEYIVE